jgi:hypothetical protein
MCDEISLLSGLEEGEHGWNAGVNSRVSNLVRPLRGRQLGHAGQSRPHAASLRSLHGANHVGPLRGPMLSTVQLENVRSMNLSVGSLFYGRHKARPLHCITPCSALWRDPFRVGPLSPSASDACRILSYRVPRRCPSWHGPCHR